MTLAFPPHAVLRARALVRAVLFEREHKTNLDRLVREQEAASAYRVPDSYGTWLATARPGFVWTAPHFRLMQAELDAITAGTSRRAFFEVAQRHGKTEHNTIGYSAYRLERDPRTRVLVTSYNQTRASDFSLGIRAVVHTRGVRLSREREAGSHWQTLAGGGVRALGRGTGAAGVNADLIIVDDPLGTREEAESPAIRNMTWDWLTNDILARAEPHTAVIGSMSRWHQDDPAGRLRDRQGALWRFLRLPARAEENDPLGRPLGAPLWPEVLGHEWLEEKLVELGEYGFASQMQMAPRPREGGLFKWEWWQLLDAVPAVGLMIRYWDLAGTAPRGRGHDPDYSAGALLCRMADRRTAIVDMARFRLSVAARDARLEQLAQADRATYGARLVWWIETEAGIAGADRTRELVRRLQALGMPTYTEHPTGSKKLRAEPLASAAEAGNVLLCPGAWRDSFRLEAANFTGLDTGAHDDQIDSAAAALAKLNVGGPWQQVRVVS